MTIEVMFGALIGMLFILMGFIIGLHGKINDLKNEIACYNKRLMTIQDEIEKANVQIEDVNDVVEVVDNRIDTVISKIDDVGGVLDDFIEEYGWTPEPEEEDGGDLEAGELIVEVDELPIHLITPNQYFFEKGHDKFDMQYDSVSGNLLYCYSLDGVSENVLDVGNISECIGDGLKYFGVSSNDDEVVYIRNNIFHADFMIKKVS